MTTTDLTDTLAPKSDQLDSVELAGGPRVFTVERVEVKPGAEQPVNIWLVGFPRPWRPGVSMRRVLAAIWGGDGKEYVGRRVQLWCDPSVEFGGQNVGGTRIRAMSHLDEARRVPLLIKRGKSAMYLVEPLTDETSPPPPRNDLSARLTVLIRESGMTRDEALPLFSGWIGREISGTKELSPDETVTVIEQLTALSDGPNIPPS